MTHRALSGVDLAAVLRVGLQRRVDLADAAAGDLVLRPGVVLHPVEVGHHRLHVGRVRWQRLTVHRAPEAAVDAFLQADDLARPGRVAGEERRDADEGRAVGYGSGVQVATGAVQLVADVRRQQLAGLQVQAHAAYHLFGVRRREHVRQAWRDEGRGRAVAGLDPLAQFLHLAGIDRRTLVAPTAADEAEDLGDFAVFQLGEAGHGVDPRVGCGLRGFPTGKGDMQ